jgi:hypothetical protein
MIPRLHNRLRPPSLGATFVAREYAERTVEMLAACPAKIVSEVVKDGKWWRVIIHSNEGVYEVTSRPCTPSTLTPKL